MSEDQKEPRIVGTYRLSPELHRRLRIYAASTGAEISVALERLLKMALDLEEAHQIIHGDLV